nr:MAG TPA: hypothetical protein [Caudoviricetes sp.]
MLVFLLMYDSLHIYTFVPLATLSPLSLHK